MPKRPWYSFYPSDYDAKTRLLSDEADLLYRRLLDALWLNDCVLPKQLQSLAKVSRFNLRKFKRVWPEISEYFDEKDEFITNSRLLEEMHKAIEKSGKAKESASKRWDANALSSKDANAHADGMLSQPHSQPHSKKKNTKKKKFTPPEKQEVIQYFLENGYTEELAIRAFDHYERGDWHDANGKPVISWKQKMGTNWFKPENLNETTKRSDTKPNKVERAAEAFREFEANDNQH